MEYSLTRHAKDVLEERNISIKWLEQILSHSEKKEVDQADKNLEHYLGRIKEYGNRVLRVVVNKSTKPVKIVTLFFDRKMKGKL